jgi:rubrerythrin
MKKIFIYSLFIGIFGISYGQDFTRQADSLKNEGLLMPALQKHYAALAQNSSTETYYEMASIYALLWTAQARDSAFVYLNYALKKDLTIKVLYDPSFLSLIEDQRWGEIENSQLRKYEVANGTIENKPFAQELFRMIIKDQGFMYVGNIERKKYMQNGGYFSTPAIFPILAMEEKNHKENNEKILKLLDKNGWPTASNVTEYAAAGAALIINHTTYEIRSKYFPMLEKAFKEGEAQPLRYAKMRDRLLVEEGKEQLFGTQWKFENSKRLPHPIEEPEYVDKRRAEIGLDTLSVYLKERFDIEWNIKQKQ